LSSTLVASKKATCKSCLTDLRNSNDVDF